MLHQGSVNEKRKGANEPRKSKEPESRRWVYGSEFRSSECFPSPSEEYIARGVQLCLDHNTYDFVYWAPANDLSANSEPASSEKIVTSVEPELGLEPGLGPKSIHRTTQPNSIANMDTKVFAMLSTLCT